MIKIKNSNLAHLTELHVSAVEECIENYYDRERVIKDIQKISEMETADIRKFLLADVSTMRKWVNDYPEKLQFLTFKEMYHSYFSNGSTKYVSGDYNAYKFLEELDITVCPYCEDEYLDIVQIDSKDKRTSEIDHFFPKSTYPALAMCFYNLIPSGQNCNGLKLQNTIGKSPYEADIEAGTFLYPDLPIGINMSGVTAKDCEIMFHAHDGMEENVAALALEQRYRRHSEEAYRLLKNVQQYSPAKIEELVKLGFGVKEEIIQNLFGPIDENEKRKTLRQKMLRDLTGY